VRAVALAGVILLLPIEISTRLAEAAGTAPGYNRAVVVTAFDVPLLFLAVASAVSLPARLRRPGRGTATLMLLAAAALFALAFHPSLRGVAVLLRLVGAVIVAAEVASLDTGRLRARVAVPLMGAAAVQGVVAFAQVVAGEPIGLDGLGERSRLYAFGDVVAGQGTTIHPYVLAGLCLLAVLVAVALAPQRGPVRLWWMAGIGAAAAPLGITFSRTAVLGLALAGLVLVPAARRSSYLRAPLTVAAVAALVPALIWSGGWVDRASASVGDDVDGVTSGRVTLTRQALELIADHPLVGVGPGRYTVALEAEGDPERRDAVHTVPLLVAAEDGIAAGVAFTAALVWVGAASFAAGTGPAALFVAMIPFLLLDKWLYLHPNGMVMLAVWLAILDAAARHRKRSGAESVAVP
jgi:hypothetical protein